VAIQGGEVSHLWRETQNRCGKPCLEHLSKFPRSAFRQPDRMTTFYSRVPMLTTLLIIWLALQPVGVLIALMLCRAASAGDRMRNLGEVELHRERRLPVATQSASKPRSSGARTRFPLVPRAAEFRRQVG
jgi:hypothetical protein